MTLNQLKYVVTVAGENSLNDAAKKLFISQPSLSNAVSALETELSTYQYKKIIKASDRATLLNLMVGMNGFTICSGIICEELNGSEYVAVKLNSDEKMTIGYICAKDTRISEIGQCYLTEIQKYKEKAML